ncbi:PREDICTED: integrin alpha-X-like [Gekko japonicus]|uniref:Integrin alpha-X-like n=1 Tax=Gekko japonicus TaxID=146911 RepID=A0ABM1JK75_GEKJA|nr:PREDICTED: integrin alpha-X-like [Gekko japonicus]
MEPTTKMKLILKAALLLYSAWGFPLSSTFSIDTETQVIFGGDAAAQFGYRVVQIRANSRPWLIVSAPLLPNHTETLFRCSYDTEQCQPFQVPLRQDQNITSEISLGLSLAVDEASDSKLIACGPTWKRRCGRNDYLNGVCYILDNFDQNLKEIHPAFQECITGVDAVILFDDSGSIRDADFTIMLDFIQKLMASVAEPDVQFAVVQFSSDPNIVVNFADYARLGGQVNDTIRGVKHRRGNTYTPTAIRFVADKVFTLEGGMRQHSKKLLIVLTDGVSNDEKVTFDEAEEATDKKGVIRYAIGVGREFLTSRRARDELRNISSSPENVFSVRSFEALPTLQKQLKEKIFAIEGTSGVSPGSSFQQEFSQGGFSTLLTPEHVVSGAVGAYGWAGGLEEESLGDRPQISFMSMSLSKVEFKDSYLGYAVALAHRGQRKFYVAGAPRYQHVGRVVVFESLSKRKTAFTGGKQLQVGSYFGAELCSVDLDADGDTDLILIGAPLYYNGIQGGLVEVHSITLRGRLNHLQTLHGISGNRLGRFGSALSSLGDVSGDGLADVAVGAPMEDGDHGAVYIFLGEGDRLREQYSQRITATTLSPVLNFFGQSLQGRLDLSGDGLTDLAVGALGNAVLLRSRPIFTVVSSLNFSPRSIPPDDPNCANGKVSGVGPRGSFSLCFTLKLISTKWSALRATISFDLRVDTSQSVPRLTLEKEARNISKTIHVGTVPVCVNKTLQAQLCLDDTVSPVVLKAKFSVAEEPDTASRNLRPVLEPGTNLSTTLEVPFQQNCGSDDVCTSDLRISFNFSGSKGLKLTPSFILNLTVKLENAGETAYEAGLSFYYPPILSFQGASVLQSTWRLSPFCEMHGSQSNTSVRHSACRFSPRDLKESTQAFLRLSFRASRNDSWDEKSVSLTVRAQSKNENDTLDDNEATEWLPVLHPVNVIVKGLESTTYLNFSTGRLEPKIISHSYEVRNLDQRPILVNVTFDFPLRTSVGFFWNVTLIHSGVKSQSVCTHPVTFQMANVQNSKEPIPRGCLGASACTRVRCLIASLSQESIRFNFSGEFFRPQSDSKLQSQKLHLRSEASVVIDESRFFQNQPEEFHYSQITTEIEIISPFNPIPIIVGSSIGGLVLLAVLVAVLYKFGFFKRNRMPQTGEAPAGQGAPVEQAAPPAAQASTNS